MAIETISAGPCPVCGRTGVVLHDNLEDRLLHVPGRWAHRHCVPCGLTWLDPQPAPTSIGALYEGEYMTHRGAPAEPTIPAPALAYLRAAYGYANGSGRRTWLRAVRPLDDLCGGLACWFPAVPGGRLLDVGCGSGDLLCRMRRLGWTAIGVEPDPEARRVATESRNLDVVESIDAVGDEPFDGVTMHHVIEHLPDPAATLSSLAARLRPGGRLLIVTPNDASLGRRIFGRHWVHGDPPRHLQIYRRSSLAALLEASGFAVERCWSSGRFARFVWTEGVRIRRDGRVGAVPPPPLLRVASFGFQLLEQAVGLCSRDLGEELIAVARRP